MIEEFQKKIIDLAKVHHVRHDQVPGQHDEFTKETFEKFLREVQIINRGKSKTEVALNEYNL